MPGSGQPGRCLNEAAKNGGKTMIKPLATTLVMFALPGGVSMEAATTAPLINQTKDRAIVKVAED
jgi:hypothetical protein